MKLLQPYISVLVALFLVAGPWLQTGTAQTSQQQAYCDCCQGPCHGCCSSAVPTAPENSSDDNHDNCSCSMSSGEPAPEAPLETVQVRVEDRWEVFETEVNFSTTGPNRVNEARPLYRPVVLANDSPPLFVLNASFLI